MIYMSSFISDSIISFLWQVIAKKMKLKILFVKEWMFLLDKYR